MLRVLAAFAAAPVLLAQNGPGVQQPPFKNELLDNLAGIWTITSAPGTPPVRGGADAVWELGHQWLRFHLKEIEGLEFVMYIGFDTYDQRMVAIRMDSISARGAETNGYGVLPSGNKFVFNFEYPTVPFRHTWTWDPQNKTWQFLVESKDRKTNTWSTVSLLTLHRFPLGGRRGGLPEIPRGLPPQPPSRPQNPLPPQ